MGMDIEREHLVQQVSSKHLSPQQRHRGGERGYLVQERYKFMRMEGGQVSSVHITEITDWLVLHYAQVVHGPAEGDLDSFTNARCATFHHFDLVYGLVYPQGNHLGSRKPLPEAGKQHQYHENRG